MARDYPTTYKDRVILDLCAGSGRWSAPYEEAGYDVRRYEIEDGDDVRLLPIFGERIYGILAAPPCTNFSLAKQNFHGVTEAELMAGLSVVDACIRIITANRPYFWALENPVGAIARYIGRPALIFEPYEYGDGYTKRTCLWGRFKMPKKCPVPITEPCKIKNLYHYDPAEKARRRAYTPAGFARAFFEVNR